MGHMMGKIGIMGRGISVVKRIKGEAEKWTKRGIVNIKI